MSNLAGKRSRAKSRAKPLGKSRHDFILIVLCSYLGVKSGLSSGLGSASGLWAWAHTHIINVNRARIMTHKVEGRQQAEHGKLEESQEGGQRGRERSERGRRGTL